MSAKMAANGIGDSGDTRFLLRDGTWRISTETQ